MRKAWLFFVMMASVAFYSCKEEPATLFRLLPPDRTGVDFNNEIIETDSFNILTFEYIYNGGGVGVADFNNDGKTDIFFTGNQVKNRLYINQGDFRFTDITEVAGVNLEGRWNSGVAVADINNDGWQDIYVCATTYPDAALRKNMLFVNQGLNADGAPTFKEQAGEYKIDFDGFSVMSAFLDYDRDGDLDLYILVNVKVGGVPTNYRDKIVDGSSPNNDRLFRNNGNGTFTDVSVEAGIVYEGFGLGIAVNDFNVDGWPDLYVSNDYLSNDILYLNNQNGTFSNRTKEFIGHQSQFSMGSDAADFNNDALPDIVTLDMLPETNERKKTTIGNKSYSTYVNNEKYGYEYQYVRNMLHLNNGLNRGVKFSEIGQLSGIYQTEWSWSALFVDFDNDGNKDLAVTNGFPKDITDKDFANYRAEYMNIASPGFLVDSIPIVKIPNYAFQNKGDLTFTDVSKEWGLNQPSFSNGAAFADFDNDGDLDYVINNINSTAFLYENTLYTKEKKESALPGYLRLKLNGFAPNKSAIGATVTIHYDKDKVQSQYISAYRGFLSSVDLIAHFGLGPVSVVDSVIVDWPDGKRSTLKNEKANQLVVVDYSSASSKAPDLTKETPLFTDVSNEVAKGYLHTEEDLIDFNTQRTIPHKFSQMGPGVAVGDLNGDSLEDFIVGGSSGRSATVFIQRSSGSFDQRQLEEPNDKTAEDTGLLLFDLDNDGDLDIYAVSGSFEWEVGDLNYQDRIYKNDGRGNFTRDPAVPNERSSGSCVKAADFDRDGDLDLFVGGRTEFGKYPLPAQSFLLRNDNGTLTDATETIAPGVGRVGMVLDAIWSDYDGDGWIDLLTVGEFMAITPFKNINGKLEKQNTTLDNYKGWWNSIAGGDFDQDGDIDYVAGNLGRNNYYGVTKEHPLRVYAKDFDSNNSMDAILTCYLRSADDSYKEYPVHFWDELNQQSPRFRRQFNRYKQFSKADITGVLFPKDMEGATILVANHTETSYIENLGNGSFEVRALSMEAQFSPVLGTVVSDFNGDGFLDVAAIGNDFGNEVFSGRYDASTGMLLLGDGKGNFRPTPSSVSNFYVPGDSKALARLSGKGSDWIVASQNRDQLKVFRTTGTDANIITPQPLDAYVVLDFADGRKQRIEFYYGSSYLSQSSRVVKLPANITKMVVYDFAGNSREVNVPVN